MAQMGFFDLSDRYASLDAKRDALLEINSVVPWEEFRAVLEQVWCQAGCGSEIPCGVPSRWPRF